MIPSERVVADHLDALGVEWEYEPTLFVLATDESGHCVEGFQPDFYLPSYDLYIEVTMAKQQTQKNRKIRRLRECHVDVQVYLFNRGDFDRPRERLQEILSYAAAK